MATLSIEERQKLKEERCRRSTFWQAIYFLGSLQMALILLAIIALACAVATFVEPGFSTRFVQVYIYKSPWFVLWLVVLCVNLFAVTMTRWPWEKRHTGFILTHYGIILLLAGAMVGLVSGFEGNVTLRKGEPPVQRVVTNRSVVQVQSPDDPSLYVMPFDAELSRPSEMRPRKFPVPGSDLTIVADKWSQALIRRQRLIESDMPGASPGVHLRLSSPMVKTPVDVVMALDGAPSVERDFFGMAKVRLVSEFPRPKAQGDVISGMIFAKFAPVFENHSGELPLEFRVSNDGGFVSIFGSGGVGATFANRDLVGATVEMGGVFVKFEKYWPHFGIENGVPVNLSTADENPAFLVRIWSPGKRRETGLAMELGVEERGIRYRLLRDGLIGEEGVAAVGEKFRLGWADWVAEVLSFSPHAVAVEEIVEAQQEEVPLDEGLPGFRAFLVAADGKRGPSRWLPSGEVTSLTDGRRVVRIGYGLETKSLPFEIKLLKFEVPRDEGTDQPADFRATVEFRDLKDGKVKQGVARMNQPASFPGNFWANLTGLNYKFSQAEWNPRNLDETTLQVLYDPGWLLKWIGSLGICFGVFAQFYLSPKKRKRGGTSSTPKNSYQNENQTWESESKQNIGRLAAQRLSN